MPTGPVIVIEHLEDKVTRWLVEEYVEAVSIAESRGARIVFAGVQDPMLEALLRRHGAHVVREPGWLRFNTTRTIVLDPAASKPLQPWEAANVDYIIIGGIMGDHPPRGRTRLISFMYTNAAQRNLGPHQLSIDGAVRVALDIAGGRRLEDLKFVVGVRFEVEGLPGAGSIEVELPFAYPVDESGRPLIARGVLRLLARGLAWDEHDEFQRF